MKPTHQNCKVCGARTWSKSGCLVCKHMTAVIRDGSKADDFRTTPEYTAWRDAYLEACHKLCEADYAHGTVAQHGDA